MMHRPTLNTLSSLSSEGDRAAWRRAETNWERAIEHCRNALPLDYTRARTCPSVAELGRASIGSPQVDADGMLSASYKHKLSNISTLTLATVIDTVHLAESSKHKFGLALNLTP